MKELAINNIRMLSEILQQYRKINLSGNKFFYYSYAKLDIKLQSIIRERHLEIEDICEHTFEDDELTVNIEYDEILALLQRDRMVSRDYSRLINSIKDNSSFILKEGNITSLIFLYSMVKVDRDKRKITVEFNKNAVKLFQMIRENSFVNINFDEIMNIETKYQMNLYLYCLTLLRGNSGKIRISIDKLYDILAGDNALNDAVFMHRFITTPSKELNNNKKVNLLINCGRENNNVWIEVARKWKVSY